MTVGQDAFRQALLDPGSAVPPGLVNPDGAPATKRFDVYRNNVVVSLIEALKTAFPAIAMLLGAENFQRLASLYVRQHPPSSPLMMFYGEDMPGFLEGFAPLAKLPYLADLARLELALRHSYHAEDASPLDPTRLQDLPADRLMAARLRFAPTVRLCRSRYPIASLWRHHMTPDAAEPKPGGQNVLVIRPEFDPDLTVLPPGGGTFVSALIRGVRFGEALEATTQAAPEFDLSATLGLLISGAALTEIDED